MVRKALLAAVAAVTLAVPAVSMAQDWGRGPAGYGYHHAWYRPEPRFGWGFYRPRPIFFGPECVRQVRYDEWGYRHVVTRCY